MNFTSQAENLAIESLYYILSSYPAARVGLSRFLVLIDPRLEGELFFKRSYDEDAPIPNLVGLNPDFDQTCIIESKFWAGLTDNQRYYING